MGATAISFHISVLVTSQMDNAEYKNATRLFASY